MVAGSKCCGVLFLVKNLEQIEQHMLVPFFFFNDYIVQRRVCNFTVQSSKTLKLQTWVTIMKLYVRTIIKLAVSLVHTQKSLCVHVITQSLLETRSLPRV